MTIKGIAAKYSISERTARRYLKRCQLPLPPESRCLGMDGKRYPRDRPRNLSPLHKPLAIARANIRRAASADKFLDGDLVILKEIVMEGARLVENWESVTRCV